MDFEHTDAPRSSFLNSPRAQDALSAIKRYYSLTKPGIIYGNVLTAAGGFLLAAAGQVAFGLFAATLGGTSLVIGAACVFNNFIDRDIDQKMARTQKRALVRGTVSAGGALAYATALCILGFLVLALWTNVLVVLIGVIGFLDYVVVYDASKRRTAYGTLVGSISGAAPITAGYVAVTDRLNGGALILFLMLVVWQMAHFFSIAIYRREEYAAASIPVLPVVRGNAAAKRQIVAYIVAFLCCIAALSVFGYAGWGFAIIMTPLGLVWLWLGLGGRRAADDSAWARSMFGFSLIIIMALSAALALGNLLP